MTFFNIVQLLGCISFCLFIGGLGGLATTEEVNTWYLLINKPEWNPPNWVFAPVWTTLYALMGAALYLVWQQQNVKPIHKKIGIAIFIVQLLLNFLWSFIFFKWHAMGWAVIEIAFLWLAIVLTIVMFYKVQKLAAWILLPYLAWVSFATFLTFTLWRLN
jgi:benzodiazapine receptor